MASVETYPLRVEADLEPGLSRWLWLVKWFLAIPHFVVLSFLWVAYMVLTVVAFFAILITGRYPRSIFEFNVGVLRWSWRVADYTFGVLGTDRYPPFTLADVPDYPAHIEVEYPERLSRGLALVKWILVIPHLLIAAVFVGSGWAFWYFTRAGLIGLLVLVAAVTLAFTGRYPESLFDLILGLNRWVLRVAAYAGFMTDRYPPFRLDMGGSDPVGTLASRSAPAVAPAATGPALPTSAAGRPRSGWTGWRITSVVLGSILALVSVGLLGGGGVLLWADQTQRDPAGYISTGLQRFTAPESALTYGAIRVHGIWPDWNTMQGEGVVWGGFPDTLRVRVTPSVGNGPVFVGIGPADAVAGYLSGVSQAKITDPGEPSYRVTAGGIPASPPTAQTFWVRSSSGSGTRTLEWPIRNGTWTVVVMNADGAPGLDVRADAGATFPPLLWIAVGLLIAGGVVLAAAVAMIVVPARRAARPATA